MTSSERDGAASPTKRSRDNESPHTSLVRICKSRHASAFRMKDRGAFVAYPVLFEIGRHDPYAVCQRQLGERRLPTGNVKIARAIPDAQVTKADSI